MKRALCLFLWLFFWTGVIYPLGITLLAELVKGETARGSLLTGTTHQVIGSRLVGQSFKEARYFWPRPSACAYGTLPSTGSNLGPTSRTLQTLVQQRKTLWPNGAPSDLLFASGSGLDPHISPEAALLQVARIAAARQLDPKQVIQLVNERTQPRIWGFIGMPFVNVLELNIKLDEGL